MSSPYTRLFNEEEAGPSFRMVEELRNQTNNFPGDKNTETPQGIFTEGSTAYSYDDSEDINLFVSPSSNFRSKWKESLQVLKMIKFWMSVIACVGIRSGMLLFWILLPPLAVIKIPSTNLLNAVILSIIGGSGTLVASIISYWNPSNARNLIFGFSNWICCFVLLGTTNFTHFYFNFIRIYTFSAQY